MNHNIKSEIQLVLPVAADGSGGYSATAATPASERQYSTSSNSTPGTANETVFTLASGEKGFIQNLDDAALAVKYGAGATTSSFSFILKAGSAADDGNGGSVIIDDWIGPVSVIAMSGTARYIATKLS